MLSKNNPRDVSINIRIHNSQRDFIDHAAKLSGKTRSDFMLEAAFRQAEEVMLDRRLFLLDEKQWTAFMDALDSPPKPGKQLKRLISTPAPWE